MASDEQKRREMGIVSYDPSFRTPDGMQGVRLTMAVPTINSGEIQIEDVDLIVPSRGGEIPDGVRIMGQLSATVTALILQQNGRRRGPRLNPAALLQQGKDGQPLIVGLLGAGALLLNKPSGKSTTNPSTNELPMYDPRRGYTIGEVVQWQDANLTPGIYVSYGYNGPGVTPVTAGAKFTKLAAFPFTAGAWDAAATYSPGQVVAYGGALWICWALSLNNVPSIGSGFWAQLTLAAIVSFFSPDGEALQRDPLYRQALRQSATLGADPPPIVSTAVSTAYDSIDVAPGAATGGGAATAQVLSSAETASVGEQIRWQEFGIKVVCAGAGTGAGALVAVTVPYSGAFLRAPDVRIKPRNLLAATKSLWPSWSADNKVLTINAGVDPGAAGDLRFDVVLSPKN